MRPFHATAWLILAIATGWVAVRSERASRRSRVPSRVVVTEDVVYRAVDRRRLSLDIYGPPPGPAGTRRPAILMIHGGSWVGGSKRHFRPSPWNPHPTAIRMAEAGFVVLAADYRLARPGVPGWPAALDDLREAVRWTRRHAGEWGIDPDRIAALGFSAGGHLAALLGTSAGLDEEARVRAVVCLYAPSDLERLPSERVRPLAHEPVRTFLGAGSAHLDGRALDASPLRRIDGGTAPMLLIHGTEDRWVPIRQSEAMAAALAAADVGHDLIRVDGARHGFDLVVEEPGHRDLSPEIFAFLETVWNVPSR